MKTRLLNINSLTKKPLFIMARLLILVLACASTNTMARTTYMVLVIDDLGHKKIQGLRATYLPGKTNLAILPYRKHSGLLLDQAKHREKEVLLHAPMSNTLQKDPGEGVLTDEMSREEIQQTLEKALSSLPGIKGINNHMGSQLTQNDNAMAWVMEVLCQQGLYFLDSRTTAKTIAASKASDMGIPNLQRDIFLDHQQSLEYIDNAFKQAIAISKEKGVAVVIGHPHKITMDYLEYALPGLEVLDIELLYVSEAIALQYHGELPGQANPALARQETAIDRNPAHHGEPGQDPQSPHPL